MLFPVLAYPVVDGIFTAHYSKYLHIRLEFHKQGLPAVAAVFIICLAAEAAALVTRMLEVDWMAGCNTVRNGNK